MAAIVNAAPYVVDGFEWITSTSSRRFIARDLLILQINSQTAPIRTSMGKSGSRCGWLVEHTIDGTMRHVASAYLTFRRDIDRQGPARPSGFRRWQQKEDDTPNAAKRRREGQKPQVHQGDNKGKQLLFPPFFFPLRRGLSAQLNAQRRLFLKRGFVLHRWLSMDTWQTAARAQQTPAGFFVFFVYFCFCFCFFVVANDPIAWCGSGKGE